MSASICRAVEDAWGALQESPAYQTATHDQKLVTLACIAADGFCFFQGGGNSGAKADTARHARVGLLATTQGGFKHLPAWAVTTPANCAFFSNLGDICKIEPRALGLLMPWKNMCSESYADSGAKLVGSFLFLSAFSGLRKDTVLSCEEASCKEHDPARYIRKFVAVTRVPVIAARHAATPIESRRVAVADVAKAFRGGPRPSYSFVDFVEAVGCVHGFPVLSTAKLAEQTWKIANGIAAGQPVFTEGFGFVEGELSKQFSSLLSQLGMAAENFNLCGGLSKDAVVALFAARQCYQASYALEYLSCWFNSCPNTSQAAQCFQAGWQHYNHHFHSGQYPPLQGIQYLHDLAMGVLRVWESSHPGPDQPKGLLVPVGNGGGGAEHLCRVVSAALAVDLCGLKPGLFVRDTMDAPLRQDVYWETTQVYLLGPKTGISWTLVGPMLQPV